MASIEEAWGKVVSLEFNSPANALHYNEGEKGYTFMGVYQFAHPEWNGWIRVTYAIKSSKTMADASKILYADKELIKLVRDFYKTEFWDKMKLDQVTSQKIAEEMMVFGVNAGIGSAVKAAQKVVGVVADGVIGSKTIAALNSFDPKVFDVEFDKAEIAHYEMLVSKNPSFVKFINGWRNRAVAV